MDNNFYTQNEDTKKAPVFTKRARVGSYTVVTTAILLAVLIVVNLLVNALPSKYTVIDTSVTGMYTLSETSEKFISKLDADVTIYLISEGGNADIDLLTFAERYRSLSSGVSIEIIDPVKDPTFVSRYTDNVLSNNSFIVVSEKRHKVIDNTSLFYYYAEGYGRVDPTDEYTLMMLQYYGYPIVPFFDGENALTGAIEYVTVDDVPKAYILSGHGEAALPTVLLAAMSDNNVEHETLDIVNDAAKIPENAACIIISDPKTDISKTEAEKLLDYLKGGGHLFLATDYDDTGLTNLLSVLEYYGASAIEGMVYEGSSASHATGVPYKIFPAASKTHEITKELLSAGCVALMPSAHAISLEKVRDSVKAEAIFTTSSSAYLMSGDEKVGEEATYNLGVAISEETADGTAKIVWLSSSDMLSEAVSQEVSYGNYYYYLISLSWMFDGYDSRLAEISGTSLQEPTLVVSERAAKIWSVIFIGVLPAIVLLPGLLFWARRRRR